MSAITPPAPDLQRLLTAQGLTCRLLQPTSAAEQNAPKIDRVIIHQAGPGSGFTEETAKLYTDILTEGRTAVLMYSPLSGRFGTHGVVEELSLIVQGVQAVYGVVDLAAVATSGGQKVILKASAEGVFGDNLKACVFINGILTPDWRQFSDDREIQINSAVGIKRRPKDVKTSAPRMACPARREMGFSGFLKMVGFNWLGRALEAWYGGYAFYYRIFYLSYGHPSGVENKHPRFLKTHPPQETYDILRRRYLVNAGVFSLARTLYAEDLTESLTGLATSGTRFFIVRGDLDGVVNEAQSQETLRIIQEASGREASFLLIHGCSHMVEVEKPGLLSEKLDEFFRRTALT